MNNDRYDYDDEDDSYEEFEQEFAGPSFEKIKRSNNKPNNNPMKNGQKKMKKFQRPYAQIEE